MRVAPVRFNHTSLLYIRLLYMCACVVAFYFIVNTRYILSIHNTNIDTSVGEDCGMTAVRNMSASENAQYYSCNIDNFACVYLVYRVLSQIMGDACSRVYLVAFLPYYRCRL